MKDAGFLLLTAGFSTRFGDDKLAAPMPSGKSVLETTLAQLPRDYPLHAVCRPNHSGVIAILEEQDIAYSINQQAESGMATSIAHGVRETAHWRGWVICLADMPWIRRCTYKAIIAALTRDNIVVPVTGPDPGDEQSRQRGNPVAFGCSQRQALQALHGDRGARSVVRNQPALVRELNVKDRGILLDIDHPDDINNHAN